MQINSDEMSRITFLIEQQSGCEERLFNFVPGPSVNSKLIVDETMIRYASVFIGCRRCF
jgi:hypothetical protein